MFDIMHKRRCRLIHGRILTKKPDQAPVPRKKSLTGIAQLRKCWPEHARLYRDAWYIILGVVSPWM